MKLCPLSFIGPCITSRITCISVELLLRWPGKIWSRLVLLPSTVPFSRSIIISCCSSLEMIFHLSHDPACVRWSCPGLEDLSGPYLLCLSFILPRHQRVLTSLGLEWRTGSSKDHTGSQPVWGCFPLYRRAFIGCGSYSTYLRPSFCVFVTFFLRFLFFLMCAIF